MSEGQKIDVVRFKEAEIQREYLRKHLTSGMYYLRGFFTNLNINDQFYGEDTAVAADECRALFNRSRAAYKRLFGAEPELSSKTSYWLEPPPDKRALDLYLARVRVIVILAGKEAAKDDSHGWLSPR